LRLPLAAAKIVTAVLTVFGSAVLIYAIGSVLNWLYQYDNPANWTTIPALIGGVVAGGLSLLVAVKRPYPIGTVIYGISRSIFNALRSIEPLIMAVIFVVWVGLGPFAGVLALTLHTIAALGKLFSEQIEGIAEGPIEAITATGANRLQTIVYAVIPQIIPPYIAYTLYRWDINVRMSTIIGFVGGGGIGFLLSQSIRLLRYREASVMMLAIAIVVSTLDYVSSQVRSRVI
jgi:phosphonate ABC transporter permease subunit PhnE